jgi:16S rRNA processing protein RimM
MPQYFKIGKLVAAHGLKGELILVHSLGKRSNLKDLKAIFLEELKDSFIPYFIEQASAKSDTETLLQLEGIANREAARRFVSKLVWITEEDFNRLSQSSSPIGLLGYHVIEGDQDLGEVIEVIEQPNQMICVIKYQGKEALIPIHAESLKKIDKRNKKIHVDLPEGLLDLYS